MKKTRLFSILLCALLISGVLSTSASAGFTDADAIGPAYKAAVSEMTVRGVLEGFPDGSFQPDGTLKREQGAKIVAFLCLGKAAAEELKCEKAPFDDVAAGRWSAPYIAWCAEHDILHGYGNGKFGPDDTLTGDQYAKMLLCALGLAREDKNAYKGGDWFKAVREDAEAAGFYEGDPAMETSLPVTRGQAALLSLNAAEAAEEAKEAENPSPSGSGLPGGSPAAADPTPAPSSDPTPSSDPSPSTDPAPSSDPAPSPSTGGDILLPEVP